MSLEEQETYEVILDHEISYRHVLDILSGTKIVDKIPEIGVYYVLSNEKIKELKREKKVISVQKEASVSMDKVHLRSANNNLFHNEKEKIKSIWDKQWDIKKVTNNGMSHKIHEISNNISVAIIDSGIEYNHKDLKKSILRKSKNMVPKMGYNSLEEYEYGKIDDIQDKMGHGTAVAGQISADGEMKGIAPGLGINIYRVFGKKKAKTSWIIKAIIEATKDGNQIINLSFGEYILYNGLFEDDKNDNTKYDAYYKAIEFAHNNGSIVVSTMGNEGADVRDKKLMHEVIEYKTLKSIKHYGEVYDCPNNFNKTISVASSLPESESVISEFSNYGSSVDFIAPAGTLDSYYKLGYQEFISKKKYENEWVLSTHLENSYNYFFGNSFATPKVSATLALLIDKYDLYHNIDLAVSYLKRSSIKSDDAYILNSYCSLTYSYT